MKIPPSSMKKLSLPYLISTTTTTTTPASYLLGATTSFFAGGVLFVNKISGHSIRRAMPTGYTGSNKQGLGESVPSPQFCPRDRIGYEMKKRGQ